MVHDPEERRRAFTEMLLDMEAQADREGTVSAEDVLAEMDQIIEGAEREGR